MKQKKRHRTGNYLARAFFVCINFYRSPKPALLPSREIADTKEKEIIVLYN